MKLQWTPTFLCSNVLMFYFCMMESSKLVWWDRIYTFINFNSYCTFQVDTKAHSAALIGLSFKRPTKEWDLFLEWKPAPWMTKQSAVILGRPNWFFFLDLHRYFSRYSSGGWWPENYMETPLKSHLTVLISFSVIDHCF